MYKLTLALGLASATLAASQSTTTLLLMGFDKQQIDASIIGSDSAATTYTLSCPSDVDSTDCGVPPSFTFTQGPSTAGYVYTLQDPDGSLETAFLGCQITSDHGTCSGTISGGDATGTSASATSFQYSNFGTDIGAQVVTIVAGNAAPGATGSNTIASTAATTTTSATSGKTTGESGNTSSGSSTSSSSTGRSSVSTGGIPLITANAQWIIGGAAAAMAIAAL